MTQDKDQNLHSASMEAAVEEAPLSTEQLNELVKNLQSDAAQWKDKALRALADVDNIRKRSAQEVMDARKYAVGEFARELLSVQDNFERAWDAIEKMNNVDAAVKNTLAGIKMVSDQLAGCFKKAQIEKVKTIGEKLNPDLHQAMIEVESDQPAGTIVQEMQPGYTIAGRLLRPALVGVAKAKTN